MLTKIAAFVLAGSVAALTVVRAVDLVGNFRHHDRDHGRHEDRHPKRAIEKEFPAEMDGTYIFDESGDALGKFPWSAHAELELQPHGRYELRLRTNIESEMEEETSWGHYRRDGDQLILSSSGDDQHALRIEGNRLVFDADWKERIALKAAGVSKTYMERQ